MHFIQEPQVKIRVEGLSEGVLEGVEVCHVLCIVEGHQPSFVVQIHADSRQWLFQGQ